MYLDTEILPNLHAFRPNREALGGTAYLLRRPNPDVDTGWENLLVDCPNASDEVCDRITELGGIRWIVITHRASLGKPGSRSSSVAELAEKFQCDVVIQEQEGYLLPQLNPITFSDRHQLAPDIDLIWTPGHTPGSSCVFSHTSGGILFTGRHLLPNPDGILVPIRQPKTFHWPRQLRSIDSLLSALPDNAPQWICPGGNLGKLRGEKMMGDGRKQLEGAIANLTLTPAS